MNETDIKVSVIIPVYNVEDYLRKCLDSVINQTFRDIEILCIDDSSEDTSPQILEEYAQKDDRIILRRISKVNVGAVRNIGLKAARGKYVIFWDADDWFELTAIERMYSRSEETDAQVCICDASDFDSVTEKKMYHNYIRKPYPETDTFCITDCVDRIFQITSSNCWNRLIRKDFLEENDIYFPESDIIEDEAFSMLTLSLAKRITLVKKRLIHYRANRPQSLMNKIEQRNSPAVNGFWECYRLMNKRGLLDNDDVRKSFVDRICGLYIYMLKQYKSLEQFNLNYNKSIREDALFTKLWDPSWEPTPFVAEYIKARNETSEEYLFEKYLELSKARSFNKAEIKDLKAKNKKLREAKEK